MSDRYDVFVIGAGVAGMSAAEQAARRGLKVCLAEESMFGGLAVNVNHLSPAPKDLPNAGSDLAAELMTRVSDLGVTMLFESVTGLARAADGQFEVSLSGGAHLARSVIIASGARLRPLGVPGEAEFENRGVSHCADCDAPMLRGQTVTVVGGGDSALQEALVLAEFCPTVHLVHRGSAFSARPDLVDTLSRTPRITVHLRTVVEALEGADALSGVRLRDLASAQTRVQPCTGFFAYVGLESNTGYLPAAVETNAGAVRVDEQRESTLANVFAVGAVRSGFPGLLTDAMEDARTAVAAICQRLP